MSSIEFSGPEGGDNVFSFGADADTAPDTIIAASGSSTGDNGLSLGGEGSELSFSGGSSEGGAAEMRVDAPASSDGGILDFLFSAE